VEIKNNYGVVIYKTASDAKTIKEAVREAITSRAYLSRAALRMVLPATEQPTGIGKA
jgi:hypothetical protein